MAIIKCPECGHRISDKAPICPSCGVEIAGKIITCPHCGNVYFKEEKECPVCHAPNPLLKNDTEKQQESAPVAPHEEPETKSSVPPHTDDVPRVQRKRTIWIVTGLVLLLFAGVISYFYINAKNNKEQIAYEYAMQNSDINVLQNYLDTYTNASQAHRDSVMNHITRLKKIENDWQNALYSNSRQMLQEYIQKNPNSPHRVEALHKIDSLDWDKIINSNEISDFEAYVEEHPNGDYVEDADDKIKQLNTRIVQPEERTMINSLFRKFFQSLTARDQDALLTTVSSVMTSFLGTPNAGYDDVLLYMEKLYKPDTDEVVWHLPGDYSIDKKEVGDKRYEYTVGFTVLQDEKLKDSTVRKSRFKVHSKVNPDGKIAAFNMNRIIE